MRYIIKRTLFIFAGAILWNAFTASLEAGAEASRYPRWFKEEHKKDLRTFIDKECIIDSLNQLYKGEKVIVDKNKDKECEKIREKFCKKKGLFRKWLGWRGREFSTRRLAKMICYHSVVSHSSEESIGYGDFLASKFYKNYEKKITKNSHYFEDELKELEKISNLFSMIIKSNLEKLKERVDKVEHSREVAKSNIYKGLIEKNKEVSNGFTIGDIKNSIEKNFVEKWDKKIDEFIKEQLPTEAKAKELEPYKLSFYDLMQKLYDLYYDKNITLEDIGYKHIKQALEGEKAILKENVMVVILDRVKAFLEKHGNIDVPNLRKFLRSGAFTNPIKFGLLAGFSNEYWDVAALAMLNEKELTKE